MESSKESIQCVSCGNSYSGKYCNECGEKKVDKKERTIIYFLGQLVNAITFSDTKMIKSIGLLLFKPGFLSREYIDGRRNLYTKPLPLFLIINLLYFLVQPVDTFYTGYHSQTEYQSYSSYAKAVALAKMEKEGITKVEFVKKYDKAAVDYSKTLIIFLVFLFSVPLSLVFSGKKQYYFNHIIFSLGYISFLLLGPMLLLSSMLFGAVYVLENLMGITVKFNINEVGFSSFLIFLLGLYLVVGLKRFYQQKYIWIIPKALFLVASTIVIVIGYRFLMFFFIIHSI